MKVNNLLIINSFILIIRNNKEGIKYNYNKDKFKIVMILIKLLLMIINYLYLYKMKLVNLRLLKGIKSLRLNLIRVKYIRRMILKVHKMYEVMILMYNHKIQYC